MLPWPESLAINAWTGEGDVAAPTEEKGVRWGLTPRAVRVDDTLAAGEPPDLREWRDEKVGWGLLLPDNPAISTSARAEAADAPEPVRELVAARRGPVFRYSASFQDRFLARDHPDGRREFVAVSGSPRGLGPKSLPYYLLIYGSPEVVPWSIQYMLNGTCFTGRLGLRDEALANYVAALRSGWEGSRRRRDRPVLWTVDFGGDDITHLMRQAVAEPLFSRWRSDGELVGGATLLAGTDATASRLADALAASSPALVVTTSHGATGPLSDPAAMRARLGLPVDQDHLLVGPETLAGWEPDGAIWYAHACCSAGCDGRTVYDGLVRAGSTVEATLKAIAALGARVAPLPEDLLGRKKPLAAFVGHVEPTFDWTLRQPETGQFLTATLLKALYDGMYRAKPEPVGLALDACYDHVGELLRQSWQAQTRFAQEADPKRRREWQLAATRTQLMALDRQAMVVLGDPTACLPTGGE